MDMMTLTQAMKDKAYDLGFSMVGVVPARPSPFLHAYLEWIDRALHGEMGYMARPDRIIRRQDLNVILPGVQSIISLSMGYFTQRLPPEIANDPARGRISNYAWGMDYHELMTPRLKQLGRELAQMSGSDVKWKIYTDTGAILERDLAAAAGHGFNGKNTMLINPQKGSHFFLAELLTTAPLIPDTPALDKRPSCGSCSRCLTACPTDAFPKPFTLDARRCISYLTIELKGAIPRELRPLMGNWVYGCDICQDVCPFNRFSQPTNEQNFHALDFDSAAPPLLDLLSMGEQTFDEKFANSPIKRIRRRKLLRNACVAAGNWGDPILIPALVALLSDKSALIRSHAVWALGRINTPEAYTSLNSHLPFEIEPDVLDELKFALKI